MSENPFAVDTQFEDKMSAYLNKQTNFFLRHPELLKRIRITHETGQAVSLFEHKLRLLENESARYQSHLMELVEVARENERLNQRLHQLTLRLIEANTLHDIVDCLKEELRARFQAEVVEVKLAMARDLDRLGSDPQASQYVEFMQADKPICGNPTPEQTQALFPNCQLAIGSVALVPLRTSVLSGLLAIGSQDSGRFHSGKSVDFLLRLSELVSLKLQSAGAASELTKSMMR